MHVVLRPSNQCYLSELVRIALLFQLAFLCTFAGLLGALAIWTGLCTLASESDIPLLAAVAPYLEALSLSGQIFFLVLAAALSWLIYVVLRRRRG